METQVVLVGGLARQWMGVLLKPSLPSDEWVAAGLAAHLVDNYVRKCYGFNELLFRCTPLPDAPDVTEMDCCATADAIGQSGG